MGASIEEMLPEKVHYYLQSPYGELGEMPPSCVKTYARPFIVYCEDEEKMESAS